MEFTAIEFVGAILTIGCSITNKTHFDTLRSMVTGKFIERTFIGVICNTEAYVACEKDHESAQEQSIHPEHFSQLWLTKTN